jgi:hypothetical protein
MFSFSGASTEANLPKSINSLELILDAKVGFTYYYMSNNLTLRAFLVARLKNLVHVKLLPSCARKQMFFPLLKWVKLIH